MGEPTEVVGAFNLELTTPPSAVVPNQPVTHMCSRPQRPSAGGELHRSAQNFAKILSIGRTVEMIASDI